MSTMSQPIQTVDDIVSVSGTQRTLGRQIKANQSRLKGLIHMLTGLFVAPLLLILAVLGFIVVLADFAWFRLRNVRNGHPQPKGLWEF